ncbi:hypothetical protein [Escherichia coli]|uniref:hypothetical protein n=1 Tax=Escherichia coli TaxID=562 RepID=UPI000CFCE2F6|nr:hypothetical protein [Escherichia coli]
MASVADTTGIYLAEVQEHIKYTIAPDVSLKLIPEYLPVKTPVNGSSSGKVRLVTNAREWGGKISISANIPATELAKVCMAINGECSTEEPVNTEPFIIDDDADILSYWSEIRT